MPTVQGFWVLGFQRAGQLWAHWAVVSLLSQGNGKQAEQLCSHIQFPAAEHTSF